MNFSGVFQRRQHLLAGLSAAALLCSAVLVAHSHDTASLSHQGSTCRICHLEAGWTATPSTPSAGLAAPSGITRQPRLPPTTARVRVVVRLSSPRAPPRSS